MQILTIRHNDDLTVWKSYLWFVMAVMLLIVQPYIWCVLQVKQERILFHNKYNSNIFTSTNNVDKPNK